jgi:hypothetical protein
MGKPDGAKGSGPPAGLGDARFAKMYTDPRFQRFPKKKGKVEIDSRFASEAPLNACVQPDLAAAAAAACCSYCLLPSLMVGYGSRLLKLSAIISYMRARMSDASCMCEANMSDSTHRIMHASGPLAASCCAACASQHRVMLLLLLLLRLVHVCRRHVQRPGLCCAQPGGGQARQAAGGGGAHTQS